MKRWFIIALIFFLGVLIFGSFLGSEIFWGVFFAGFLSFIGGVLTEKWLEEKAAHEALQENLKAQAHVIRIVREEIQHNRSIAEKLQQYLNSFDTLSPNDFAAREDQIFTDFITVSHDTLWDCIVQAIDDDVTLGLLAETYLQFTCLRHVLSTLRGYVTSKVSSGSDDCRGALRRNPWGVQLFNALGKAIRTSETVLARI